MLSIAHRDIKPQNILVDKNKHLVVITDFGSAKQLVKSMYCCIQLKPTWLIFVQDAIVLPSLFLELLIILLKLICGQLDVSWLR